MSEESKRAIESFEKDIKANRDRIEVPKVGFHRPDEEYYDYLQKFIYRDSLAITAIKRNEAEIAECKDCIKSLEGIHKDSLGTEAPSIMSRCRAYQRILEILEGKQV